MIDSGRDLFEMIQNNTTSDEDLILDARYMLEQLEENTDFYIEFGERIDDYSKENAICPICGRDLVPITYHGDFGEDHVRHRCLNDSCECY